MDPNGRMPPTDSSPSVQPIRSISRTRATAKTDPQSTPPGDRVQISQRAREMQAALDQIRQIPEVDEAKVASIRAQIQAGSYQADSAAIADKLIDEALLGEVK